MVNPNGILTIWMDTESLHVTIVVKLGRVASSVAEIDSVTGIEPERRKLTSSVPRVANLEVGVLVQAPGGIGRLFPDSIIFIQVERR